MLCIWSWAFICCYYNRGDVCTVFSKYYQVLIFSLCNWMSNTLRIQNNYLFQAIPRFVFMVYFTLNITALKLKQK